MNEADFRRAIEIPHRPPATTTTTASVSISRLRRITDRRERAGMRDVKIGDCRLQRILRTNCRHGRLENCNLLSTISLRSFVRSNKLTYCARIKWHSGIRARSVSSRKKFREVWILPRLSIPFHRRRRDERVFRSSYRIILHPKFRNARAFRSNRASCVRLKRD